MILDAGVLISIDRRDPRAAGAVIALQRQGVRVHTTQPVVAQVWRDGARQARLAQVLRTVDVHRFDDGRAVGRLLQASGTADVVDAHLVLLAAHLREPVLTGDADDLRRVAAAFGADAPTIHAWP